MKLKVFIHAKKDSWKDDFDFVSYSCDMSSCGYVLVEKREIEFTPPDRAGLIQPLVDGLREQQKNLRAEMQVKINAIEDEIGKLLALSAPEESE